MTAFSTNRGAHTRSFQHPPRTYWIRGTLILAVSVLAAISVLSFHVAAADIDAGKRAMKVGKYQRALEQLQPLARRGDPEAQYLTGVVYHTRLLMHGHETRAEALHWFRKAADNGHMTAQAEYAHMILAYSDAFDTYKEEAHRLLIAAVDAGNPTAQHYRGVELAAGYATGFEDDKSGFALLERAAAQGHGPAFRALAQFHYTAFKLKPSDDLKRDHAVGTMQWLLLEYIVLDRYTHWIARLLPKKVLRDQLLRRQILDRAKEWLQTNKPDKLNRIPARMPWETL